jgi:hypothetical protein
LRRSLEVASEAPRERHSRHDDDLLRLLDRLTFRAYNQRPDKFDQVVFVDDKSLEELPSHCYCRYFRRS